MAAVRASTSAQIHSARFNAPVATDFSSNRIFARAAARCYRARARTREFAARAASASVVRAGAATTAPNRNATCRISAADAENASRRTSAAATRVGPVSPVRSTNVRSIAPVRRAPPFPSAAGATRVGDACAATGTDREVSSSNAPLGFPTPALPS